MGESVSIGAVKAGFLVEVFSKQKLRQAEKEGIPLREQVYQGTVEFWGNLTSMFQVSTWREAAQSWGAFLGARIGSDSRCGIWSS